MLFISIVVYENPQTPIQKLAMVAWLLLLKKVKMGVLPIGESLMGAYCDYCGRPANAGSGICSSCLLESRSPLDKGSRYPNKIYDTSKCEKDGCDSYQYNHCGYCQKHWNEKIGI